MENQDLELNESKEHSFLIASCPYLSITFVTEFAITEDTEYIRNVFIEKPNPLAIEKGWTLGTILIRICNLNNIINKIITEYREKLIKYNTSIDFNTISQEIIGKMLMDLSLLDDYIMIIVAREIENYKNQYLSFNEICNKYDDNYSPEKNLAIENYKKSFYNLKKNFKFPTNIIQLTNSYLENLIENINDVYNKLDYFYSFDKKIENLSKEKRLFLYETNSKTTNNLNTPNYIQDLQISTDVGYNSIDNYDKFKDSLDINSENVVLIKKYNIKGIIELLKLSFLVAIENKIRIRKCQNCGNFFITDYTTTQKYCNNISPQRKDKTCKQYGAKRKYTEYIKHETIDSAYNQAITLIRMQIYREKNNDKKQELINIKDNYSKAYIKKRDDYRAGILKEEIILDWIKEQHKAFLKEGKKI